MGFDQTPVQALSMPLVDDSKQAHDNQGRDDTRGYDVLRHHATPGKSHHRRARAVNDKQPAGSLSRRVLQTPAPHLDGRLFLLCG